MPAKIDPSEDPSSSIIGQAPSGAYPDLEIEVEIVDQSLDFNIEGLTGTLVRTVLCAERIPGNIAGELYIRIVSNGDMQLLNNEHRGKDKPTNVLSFQAIEGENLEDALDAAAKNGPPVHFGDIIVAAPVVIEEAAQQNKQQMHHFAHLLVHGLLHLLNYDHMEDQEAELMESRERAILAAFDIADPYATEHEHG